MKTIILGHRGMKGEGLENSLEGIKRAVTDGVDGVEVDVRKSHDGKLILAHDDRLGGRIIKKRVHFLSSEQLHGEYNLAYLEEVLTYLKERKKWVNIDIKSSGCEKEIAQALRDTKIEDKLIFSGYYTFSLRKLKKEFPFAITLMSIPRERIRLGQRKWFRPFVYVFILLIRVLLPFFAVWQRKINGVDGFVVHFGGYRKGLLEMARRNNFNLFIFGADRDWMAKQLLKDGVDGIIADYPEKVLKIRN